MHFLATAVPTVPEEPGIWFVALLGITIVLLGLVCLILLCMLMGFVCKALAKKEKAAVKDTPVPEKAPDTAPIPDREEVLAAVTAVIAEELGTDVSALRIHSFRKIS